MLARGGEIKLGVEYIKRGLETIQSLLHTNLTLARGQLSDDISEAESNLRHFEEELNKNDNSPSLVAGH